MTNRNEYLRHLDLTADNDQPVRVKFSDTRTPAQRAADRSRAKLAAQLHASEREKEARRSVSTLRGIFVRRGGDL